LGKYMDMVVHNIAAFISPHGFGHAARTAAILHELATSDPHLSIELFSLVPEWFFRSSLPPHVELNYHELETDVGFVQKTSIEEDLPATIKRLHGVYPVPEQRLDHIAKTLTSQQVQTVLCDISVVGLLAAKRAGVPSVLIENFTWDWIYEPYRTAEQGFAPFIEYLAPLYQQAGTRIQSIPICHSIPSATVVGPIARRCRSTVNATRVALEIPNDATVVLMSMGGIPGRFPFIKALGDISTLHFIVAGLDPKPDLPTNVRVVPHKSPYFHPDLVAASDAIVGKVGYSTVSEAYHGRAQFFYVPRPVFPESLIMETFVREHLNGVEVPTESYESGEWLKTLEGKLDPVRSNASMKNGAQEAAEVIAASVTSAGP
jgi:hypothetical protein